MSNMCMPGYTWDSSVSSCCDGTGWGAMCYDPCPGTIPNLSTGQCCTSRDINTGELRGCHDAPALMTKALAAQGYSVAPGTTHAVTPTGATVAVKAPSVAVVRRSMAASGAGPRLSSSSRTNTSRRRRRSRSSLASRPSTAAKKSGGASTARRQRRTRSAPSTRRRRRSGVSESASRLARRVRRVTRASA